MGTSELTKFLNCWSLIEHGYNCELFYIKIVTTIPTNRLPKNMTVGSDIPDQSMYPTIDGSEDNEIRKGQVLWLRGIARLQTQVNKRIYVLN